MDYHAENTANFNSMMWIHGICWGIPLVLSLLLLSTNLYGMDDYASGDIPCDLSGNYPSKFIWLDSQQLFCDRVRYPYDYHREH